MKRMRDQKIYTFFTKKERKCEADCDKQLHIIKSEKEEEEGPLVKQPVITIQDDDDDFVTFSRPKMTRNLHGNKKRKQERNLRGTHRNKPVSSSSSTQHLHNHELIVIDGTDEDSASRSVLPNSQPPDNLTKSSLTLSSKTAIDNSMQNCDTTDGSCGLDTEVVPSSAGLNQCDNPSTDQERLCAKSSGTASKECDTENKLEHDWLNSEDFDLSLLMPICEITEDGPIGDAHPHHSAPNKLKGGCDDLETTTENSKVEKSPVAHHIPYYLKNFLFILNYILKDDDGKRLFNEEDQKYIQRFLSLSDGGQKLYVRMFQRKHKWLRMHKLEYQEIGCTDTILKELTKAEMVETVEELSDLETALRLLSAGEMKMLSKKLNVNIPGKGKSDTIQMLLKHGKEHRSVFGSSQTVASAMLNIAKRYVGVCYRLASEPRKIFSRIMLLFALPSMMLHRGDPSSDYQSILTLLMTEQGKLTFPDYVINKQAEPFADRQDLIRFEEAVRLEEDMMGAIEKKDFASAHQNFITAKKCYETLQTADMLERDSKLPTFLRRFTAGYVYLRCLSHGVDVLQRLKKYEEAVQILHILLSQQVYSQHHAGHWWERLALNLEFHLKQPEKAMSAILDGLKDLRVNASHRLTLYSRAVRVGNALKKAKKDFTLDAEAVQIKDAPKITLQGKLYPYSMPGKKSYFILDSEDSTAETQVLSVEELALHHYKKEGFTEGIHGEGMTYHAVFGTFFWDIIYATDLPDAFRSAFQSLPLDLNSEEFYLRREAAILDRIKLIQSLSNEEMELIVADVWKEHQGKMCLISWDRFKNVQHFQTLVCCLGVQVVAGICEKLARDFRHWRSGQPDLLVWNPVNGKLKAVEVKGPDDHLSTKQQLWLDYLMSLGVDVEVCNIKSVGSKRLKKRQDD